MKRYYSVIFILLYFWFYSNTGFAQDYSISKIKEKLITDAGSVVRTNEMVFSVKSRSEAIIKQKYAITILHKSHRKNSIFRETYDRFSNISLIKINIYDKNGKRVKRVPNSDILDLSTFSQSALFADIRQKYYNPEYYEYPFTIEWSYTKTLKGILSYPNFYTVDSYDMSLESGKFIVNIPAELRYLSLNTLIKPKIEQIDIDRTYTWNFENIGAIRNEDYDLRLVDLIPVIKIAPSQFEMDGYIGNGESWDGFGKWIYSLNIGRDELSPSVKMEINEITAQASGKREKIQLVYEYMQSETRYVNVVIGIGGWQPLFASEVEKNGYGDCKALTNYTYSLLKAINIESYYSIIKAGNGVKEIESEFPSNQFNHAILCVPVDEDTVWLECTSQRNPFGYLGTFTDGRDALIIKENNSKLVRTPEVSIEESLRQRKAVIKIDEQGNSTAIIEKKYQGYYYDDMRSVYYQEGKRRMDRVRNRIHINNFVLNDEDYNLLEQRSDHPYFTEYYNVTANRYVKKLGNRLLFNINFFNTETDVPSAINNQESEIYIQRSLTRIDSLEFNIPEGYFIKSFPKNDSIITNYGEFYTNFELDENKLYYTRKQLINKGIYPSDEYSEFRSYLKKISLADKQKILVMPKEN